MSAEKMEVELEDEDDFEIEIEDDTPEQDRGRSMASDDESDDDDVDDEELKNYSAGAAKRIKTLTRQKHDERRAKEAKERQLQEAISLTQKLRQQLGGAAKAVVTRDKEALTAELEQTKKALAAAVETGDGEAMADLTEKVGDIRSKLNGALRAEKEIAEAPEQKVTDAGDPSDRSSWPESRKSWYDKNKDWFHKDEEMTGYVYGLHQKIIKEGVAPDSEEYYERINKKMRTVFKDYFAGKQADDEEDDDVEEERPAPRRAQQRTATFDNTSKGSEGKKKGKGKVFKLTKSQADLCRRLNITPEQYIKEQLALESE